MTYNGAGETRNGGGKKHPKSLYRALCLLEIMGERKKCLRVSECGWECQSRPVEGGEPQCGRVGQPRHIG